MGREVPIPPWKPDPSVEAPAFEPVLNGPNDNWLWLALAQLAFVVLVLGIMLTLLIVERTKPLKRFSEPAATNGTQLKLGVNESPESDNRNLK